MPMGEGHQQLQWGKLLWSHLWIDHMYCFARPSCPSYKVAPCPKILEKYFLGYYKQGWPLLDALQLHCPHFSCIHASPN